MWNVGAAVRVFEARLFARWVGWEHGGDFGQNVTGIVGAGDSPEQAFLWLNVNLAAAGHGLKKQVHYAQTTQATQTTHEAVQCEEARDG